MKIDFRKRVIDHLTELADAWQRGCITEHDGKGGTRSNRNAELLADLLAELGPEVWAVFDADGCECKDLSAVFATEVEANDFAVRLKAAKRAEVEEMYAGENWRPIEEIISVEALTLGTEPDISSKLMLIRENKAREQLQDTLEVPRVDNAHKWPENRR